MTTAAEQAFEDAGKNLMESDAMVCKALDDTRIALRDLLAQLDPKHVGYSYDLTQAMIRASAVLAPHDPCAPSPE